MAVVGAISSMSTYPQTSCEVGRIKHIHLPFPRYSRCLLDCLCLPPLPATDARRAQSAYGVPSSHVTLSHAPRAQSPCPAARGGRHRAPAQSARHAGSPVGMGGMPRTGIPLECQLHAPGSQWACHAAHLMSTAHAGPCMGLEYSVPEQQYSPRRAVHGTRI
jgi:hypothetical protein